MSRKKFPMRVIKGGFAPADQYVQEELRARKYAIGDIVFCTFTKPRNPKFHRLVFKFGQMIVENIQGFEYLDAYTALKRIQIEADIACDEISIMFPGIGPTSYRMPQSLSYESMDEGSFNKVFEAFCAYVADKYWPDLTEEQVREMAELIE